MKKLILIILCLSIFPAISFADFTDNGDGTVTDNDTGLMWMQTTGDTDNDGDVDTDDAVDWENALLYCANLNFATYDDWRLPNNKELQSIVDYTQVAPSINTTVFPDTIATWYWTSTTFSDNFDDAWTVYFYFGDVVGKAKNQNFYVRAVRGGL